MDSFASTAPEIRLRVKVFLDFWNFTLSMRSEDPQFQVDYRVLGQVLARAAIDTVDPAARLDYEGMIVYGSYGEGRGDAKLRAWFNTISEFTGVTLRSTPRRRTRRTIHCPSCQVTIDKCPSCASELSGFTEKGVDVRLATDLTGLAWSDRYDIGVLVSSDRDFIPMAEMLELQNRKIVHAAFPPKASELSRRCWSHISIPQIRHEFRRADRVSRRLSGEVPVTPGTA